MAQALYILVMSFLQNISFSVVSRARNRDNFAYLMVASVLSNGIWFLTFRALVLADMNWVLFIPYTAGTVFGSLGGAGLSMRIEQWLHASSDAHLGQKTLSPTERAEVMREFLRLATDEEKRQWLAELQPSPSPAR